MILQFTVGYKQEFVKFGQLPSFSDLRSEIQGTCSPVCKLTKVVKIRLFFSKIHQTFFSSSKLSALYDSAKIMQQNRKKERILNFV